MRTPVSIHTSEPIRAQAPWTSITWNWRKARQNGMPDGSSAVGGRKTIFAHRMVSGALGFFQKIW